MEKIKAIIVEDELIAAEILRKKLKNHFSDISIIDICNNVAEAKKSMCTLDPDLVFSDVHLGDGNIFTVLRSIGNTEYPIIFVTSDNNYMHDAIKHCAVGYVLKPIEDSELRIAVNNALYKINERRSREKNVTPILQYIQQQTEKIALSTLEGMQIVSPIDIIYCQGDAGSTWVYLKSGVKLLSSYSIGYYKELLSNPRFLIVHKSYVVNIDHICSYDKRGTIIMTNGHEVLVGRTFKKDFLHSFKRIQN